MVHEDTTAHLAGGLPEYYPSSDESGNYALLESIAGELDTAESDIDSVDIATTVQEAQTIAQLEEIGKLVATLPKQNEDLEHYRARLIAEFAILTVNGTIDDLFTVTTQIFDVSKTDLSYAEAPPQGPSGPGQLVISSGETENLSGSEELSGIYFAEGGTLVLADGLILNFVEDLATAYGNIRLGIPGKVLSSSTLTQQEVDELLGRVIAASYTINAFALGSFTYITPASYNSDNHNSELGYDGLTTNGNPKDTGGTYSGVIGDS
jgi:hypothetical protein